MKFEISSTNERSICLLATGDVYPAKLPEANALSEVVDIIYHKDVLELLHEKDISLADLECPLTTIDKPISKSGPNISAPPETIKFFQLAKFDVMVLANNHIMDYGDAALQETISVCEKAGLKLVGAGANLEAACRPLFVEVEKQRVAILAFAEGEFSCAPEATPGAAKLDLAIAGSIIQKTKKKADIVMVNVHGGNEFYPIPSPRMQNWYRFLVDCGADAIIGHHPHTIQGIEIYHDVPIIYSLGNFIFPTESRRPRCWHEGLIAKLIISNNRVCRLELFPCEQLLADGNVRIELLKGEARSRFEKRFDRLTQIASDPILVREFWKCFCDYRRRWYVDRLKIGATSLPGDWLYLFKNIIAKRGIGHLAGLCSDLMHLCQRKSTRQQQELGLRNLLFCPAHYEVLSTIIEMRRLEVEPQPEIWDEFKKLMVYCNQ